MNEKYLLFEGVQPAAAALVTQELPLSGDFITQVFERYGLLGFFIIMVGMLVYLYIRQNIKEESAKTTAQEIVNESFRKAQDEIQSLRSALETAQANLNGKTMEIEGYKNQIIRANEELGVLKNRVTRQDEEIRVLTESLRLFKSRNGPEDTLIPATD